ncbi:DNA polymerase III subunit psi [Gammaproteobacteria bacterium]|nr:DNA polymerase III subunit psi [Gammaproteobacteria bacterium]
MITSSIKTNLILKEMGITRYELRSKQESEPSKTIFSYQKGNILTLLEQSYDDLSEDEAKLLNAIVDAVNSTDKDTIQDKYAFEDSRKMISAIKKDIKGIISFTPDVSTLDLSIPFVQSPLLKKMISDSESKKILWKDLKEIILK